MCGILVVVGICVMIGMKKSVEDVSHVIITVDAVDVADAVDADEIDKLCKCFAHCTVQGKNCAFSLQW